MNNVCYVKYIYFMERNREEIGEEKECKGILNSFPMILRIVRSEFSLSVLFTPGYILED